MSIGHPHGRTLKLFLVHGTPSSVVIAGLGVSTVLTLVAPRSALGDLLARPESKRTGVYLLVGPDPALPSRPMVYVGEGDDVATRLISHDKDPSKDFFERVCLIVSKDEDFTKAHCRFLEGRLITAIKGTGRAKLINGTEPVPKGLPEAEVADMERVLAEVELVLPTLGFDVLRAEDSTGAAAAGVAAAAAPLWKYTGGKCDASAREEGALFKVLQGSIARAAEVESASDAIRASRQQLLADGSVEPTPDGKMWRFVKDVPFSSPSAAASAVYGGSVSGPSNWKHHLTNQTYGEWRQEQLKAAAQEASQ